MTEEVKQAIADEIQKGIMDGFEGADEAFMALMGAEDGGNLVRSFCAVMAKIRLAEVALSKSLANEMGVSPNEVRVLARAVTGSVLGYSCDNRIINEDDIHNLFLDIAGGKKAADEIVNTTRAVQKKSILCSLEKLQETLDKTKS